MIEMLGVFAVNGLLLVVVYIWGHGDGYKVGKKERKGMICPDCKCVMELIVPDDSEDYYKCPKCGIEGVKDEE